MATIVTVTKNGVIHDCKSEEQLKRFLKAGYKKVKKGQATGEGQTAGGGEDPSEEE